MIIHLRPVVLVTIIASVAIAAGVVVGAAAMRQAPAQTPPVFRSNAELVQVDVSVLDNKRVPVKGLTAADFSVLENGVARPVEAFSAIDLPARITSQGASWARDIPPDVATNRSADAEGRIVVILMDRSIPMGAPVTTARKIAMEAVDALGPGDLAALVSTSGGVPQNLTADRAKLVRAINQRDWSTDISDEAKAAEAAVGITPDLFGPLQDGRCLCALCLLHTITNVASALESMPRRQKSLLFIGASIIFQAGPQDERVEMGCGQKLVDARNVMWTALDRSGVRVHSIDPNGLESKLPTPTMPTFRGARAPDGFGAAVQDHLERQGSLFVLPERTGGRVVTNTNAPEARVNDIMRESASYYLLGYRPAEPQVPGQTRKIEVKVDRRDVHVSARREYAVPTAAAVASRSSLESAITSTLPVSGSQLAMSAGVFGAPGLNGGTVAITLDLSDIAARIGLAGDPARRLSMVIGAFDVFGRPVNGVDRTFSLPPAARVPGTPLEAVVQLRLPPGEFEVRAAVAADEAARPASVFATVTMPPFATLPFALSNIAIAAMADTVSIAPDRPFNLLPVVPTTRREFPQSSNLLAFVRAYQGPAQGSAMLPATIDGSVVDRDGKVRIHMIREITPDEFAGARSADAVFSFPLLALEPGEYLLSIQGVLGPRVAGRAVRFRVVN